MIYVPYKQFSNILFNESFKDLKSKLDFKKIKIYKKQVLDKNYPSIYIFEDDVLVVFSESGNEVRHIETTQQIVIDGCDLSFNSIIKIRKHFEKIDDSLYIDEEGSLESKKYGFIVSKESSQKRNNVLLFSESYLNEEVPTPDDIIRFYLGNL